MRLFVAVDLSDGARQAMAAEQVRIGGALGDNRTALRWVRVEQMHLTLVFLGSVDDALVPSVVERLGQDVATAPFEMVFGGFGAFPERGAPRVLWIGVAAGAAELIALQREIARRVVALGIAIEARPFHPHLTLGRWRESRQADRRRALAAGRSGAVARVPVVRATLYESRLSPHGATYTPLAHANLTA